MLSELAGNGWTMVEPPSRRDGENVVARRDGEPIKAGFLMERITDKEDEAHYKYRSGKYNLEVKIDFLSGHGQVRVTEAEGYDNSNK